MNTHIVTEAALDRMVSAVERVRDRLRRSTQILEQAAVPYAVVGDNAVSAWIASVDESAVRNTQKVELLVRTCDFVRVKNALTVAGYDYRNIAGIDLFADDATVRDWHSVRIVFAGEKVRPVDSYAAPEVTESEQFGAMRGVEFGTTGPNATQHVSEQRVRESTRPDRRRVGRSILDAATAARVGGAAARTARRPGRVISQRSR